MVKLHDIPFFFSERTNHYQLSAVFLLLPLELIPLFPDHFPHFLLVTCLVEVVVSAAQVCVPDK